MSPQPSTSGVESSRPRESTYQWHDYVEDVEGYCRGGYHPFHLKDEYSDGRYRIIHKLGFGSYSTVWLARDQHEGRYVAIKIIIAEALKASPESRILRRLNDLKPNVSHLSLMLDEFSIEGPNGHHQCIVSQLAGCSLAASKEASIKHKFPLNVARAIAAQAVLVVDELHSCGVVHGDLHLSNILLKMPDSNSLTIDEIYQRFGKPKTLAIKRTDRAPLGSEAPRYTVEPAVLEFPADEVTDARIILSDFGEAWISNEENKDELHTAIAYLPPEATLSKSSIGQPADIWTLGCTLYEILGRKILFEYPLPDEDAIIAEMVDTLGILPKQWWDLWPARGDFFLEDGSWKKDDTGRYDGIWRPLSLRMEWMGRSEKEGFTKDEVLSLETMLRAMLTCMPAERATADEVVESDWMKRWGLPALQTQEIEWSSDL